MQESFSLGRIAGVRVGANWSLIVVVWLITWSLADSYLPTTVAGYTTGAYWVAGALSAVTFFGCLLAHELAHSIVARRFGIEIEGIVLWLFGGVSKFTDDPPSASAELRVAAAGPLTSMGIAFGCFGVTRFIDSTGSMPLVSASLGWLGWINGSLAAFNLVPAFPLDGGRVLRAWLWSRHGDKGRATATAAKAGRAFAYVLISLGLLQFLAGVTLGGLWLVFLGWFLLAASAGEASQALMASALHGVDVTVAMTPDPVTAPADTTIDRLIDGWLFTNRCSTFPLVDPRGAVIGLITIARIKTVALDQRANTRAIDVAAPRHEVVCCDARDPLLGVMQRMSTSVDQRALVFDGERLVGIVSPSDVTRVLDKMQLSPPDAAIGISRNR